MTTRDGMTLTDARLVKGIFDIIMAQLKPVEIKQSRPTISELEAILNSDAVPNVQINPDGSVTEMGAASTTAKRLAAEIAAYIQSLPSGLAGDGWLPIESAPKGRKMLAGYANSLGKWRTITATYYLPQTLEIDEGGYDADDDGDGYAKEGWYEETETHDTLMPLRESQTPTHWQPLPEPPKSPAQAGKGES